MITYPESLLVSRRRPCLLVRVLRALAEALACCVSRSRLEAFNAEAAD